jgi:hypothetical protein
MVRIICRVESNTGGYAVNAALRHDVDVDDDATWCIVAATATKAAKYLISTLTIANLSNK